VLISNAGFPERHHFSGLEETFRRLTDSPDEKLAGMICCAGGELLRQEALQDELAWYLEAAQKAGQEVVEQGSISPETQAVLDRPLVDDPAAYASTANAYWESVGVEPLESPESAPQPASDSPLPLPPPQSMDTLRDLISGMALSFNAEAANGLEAVIQFNVTGDVPEQYYLNIAEIECTAFEGTHAKPTLTINTPAEVWMAISRGEMNGAMAMMSGKYSVKGNLGLLMQLNKLFPAAPEG
jgi:putative sterol carrier protein